MDSFLLDEYIFIFERILKIFNYIKEIKKNTFTIVVNRSRG